MFSSETGFSGTRRFQVLRQLGAGGMGVVYEAVDHDKGTRIAIKSLRHLDPPLSSCASSRSFARSRASSTRTW